ncbi:MAG TPA: ATP-binding protein [Solirubrobacteraceae bacterium]|nr:ATP-binding protein [Solirubrobacteraceae bacterium]
MSIRKFVAAIAVLVGVLALFAGALLQSHGAQRRDAERRFTERAQISAALTESIFASTAGLAAAENGRRFGGEIVERRRLERQVRESRLVYGVVLDGRGNVLAASRGLPAAARTRLAARPATLRAAVAGRPFTLSGLIDLPGRGGVLEYAAPFNTRHGRRVLVQGFSVRLISSFLGGYLGRIPGARRATAYVLDARGRVVASPHRRQPAGSVVGEPGLVDALLSGARAGAFEARGTQRVFTSARVGGTPWRVVLSTRSSALYAGTSALVQWLVLLALAGVGAVAIFLLTRWVRSAAAVASANARLARANAELEHANLELKRSNSELEQFASIASHDLQEPLRKVQSFGDQLERRFGAELSPEAVDYVRRMRSAASRMSTLIEDLLRFSRVSTRAQRPAAVDLAEVAREVVAADLDGLLQQTHGEVHIGRLPRLEADALQMRQLLQNLIANALKFHRSGVAPEVFVEPAPSADRDVVAFTVSDNGIGFDPRYEERIFRVFERLHPREEYTGTGIGLALCRKIVERHGGEISADSREGGGARFTVTLPAVAPQGPQAPRAAAATRDGSGDETRVPAHA